MPDAREIVAEVQRNKDIFEKGWILPWHEGRTTTSIWRHQLIHLLARLPEGLFDEILELLFEDESWALRGIALHLARMRGREAFEERARKALEDRSVHVRALAAAALGQFGTQEGLESLLEVKDGENAEVKKAVVDALKRIRDVRCIPLLARWVGRVGEEDDLRHKACEALADIGDEAAMPVLIRVLQDATASDEVRGEAARAIGMIGGPEARQILEAELKSDRPWIRARCIQGLGLLGDPRALPLILPALEAGNPWMVRTHAVEAFSRLAGAEALSTLERLARDPEARIRSETCVALGRLGGTQGMLLLKSLLDDQELAVRIQALDAFSRASGEDFGFRVEEHMGALDMKALEAALERARAFDVPS